MFLNLFTPFLAAACWEVTFEPWATCRKSWKDPRYVSFFSKFLNVLTNLVVSSQFTESHSSLRSFCHLIFALYALNLNCLWFIFIFIFFETAVVPFWMERNFGYWSFMFAINVLRVVRQEVRDKFPGAVEAFTRRNGAGGGLHGGEHSRHSDSSRQRSSEDVPSSKDVVSQNFEIWLFRIVLLVLLIFLTWMGGFDCWFIKFSFSSIMLYLSGCTNSDGAYPMG